MQTMRAAVVRAFGEPLRIEEVPIPRPGPGEVLVKVVATGVCHTDLHAADGDWPVKPALPFIPGHEGAGIVAAVGAGVTGLKEGDPVGVAWLHDACGACEHCWTGWETLCERQRNSGYSVNGSFAEYVDRGRGLCRPPAEGPGLRRDGADPLRRGDDLQGHQGDRGAGPASGSRSRASAGSATSRSSTPRRWACTWRRSTWPRTSWRWRARWAPRWRWTRARRTRRPRSCGRPAAAPTACWSPPSRRPPSPRRSGWCGAGARSAWSACRPATFPTPIFDVVLKRITLRGSIVGGREDLAEAIAFAAEGKVRPDVQHGAAGGRQPGVRRPEGRQGQRPRRDGDVRATEGWRCATPVLAALAATVATPAAATFGELLAWCGPPDKGASPTLCNAYLDAGLELLASPDPMTRAMFGSVGSGVAAEAEPALGVLGGDRGQRGPSSASSASRLRAALARSQPLSFDQQGSIGLRSGE